MLHERLVADVDLILLQHCRHGHDDRELLRISAEVVRHRQDGAVSVANEHDLRRLVEQLGVSFGYVETAKGAERRAPPREARGQSGCRNQSFHVSPRWASAARLWDATIRTASPERADR